MSQQILTGHCQGGPLDGTLHTQTVTPPVQSGLFNYVGLNGLRGSYRYNWRLLEWHWGPWIEEHPPGSTWEGRRLHEQYDGNGRPKP